MSKCECAKNIREPYIQCPHPAKKGSKYCGLHKNCKHRFELKHVNENVFDIIPDDSIQQICLQLYDEGNYRSLSNLIRTSKRIERNCSPILKQVYLKPHPPMIFVSNSNPIKYNVDIINSVNDLREFLISHRNYKMNENIINEFNRKKPLIYYLLDKGNIELITYLVEHNPIKEHILDIAFSNTKSTIIYTARYLHNPKLAIKLIDLGANINQLLYDHYYVDMVDIKTINKNEIKWITLRTAIQNYIMVIRENISEQETIDYNMLIVKLSLK